MVNNLQERTEKRDEPQTRSPAVGQRRCVVTNSRGPQSELLRLGLDPEGHPFVDVLGRAPGRGVYVTATRDALAQALSPKGLGRAFRGAAKPIGKAAEIRRILDETEARLRARLLELISFARRARALEIGMDAVLLALKSPPKGLVVLGAQGLSERALRKLRSTLGDIELIQTVSKHALGTCLGRELVGVVAVRPTKLAERITGEAKRLSSFEDTADQSRAQGRRDR